MSQLLLETLGHPWRHVPTENPCHRRPRLGAFIFGLPVTFGVLSSALGNAPVICWCVGRCGEALVSCFGLAGGCGRNGIPPLRPRRESVKMMGVAVESCHPRPGPGARRDEGNVGIAGIAASSWVQTSLRERLATHPPTSSSSSPPCSPSRPGSCSL